MMKLSEFEISFTVKKKMLKNTAEKWPKNQVPILNNFQEIGHQRALRSGHFNFFSDFQRFKSCLNVFEATYIFI